jgi:hypothetical protein
MLVLVLVLLVLILVESIVAPESVLAHAPRASAAQTALVRRILR